MFVRFVVHKYIWWRMNWCEHYFIQGLGLWCLTPQKKDKHEKQRSTNHYIENEIFSKSNMKTLPNPSLYIFYKNFTRVFDEIQGRRGRDRIIVGCVTTYAISNQILKRQTFRFHYGSKVPAVTITVFITILERNR
jgi:hypothetical protein